MTLCVGFYLPMGGGGGGGGGKKLMKHKSLKLGQGYDPLCKYLIMLVYDKLKFQYALQ